MRFEGLRLRLSDLQGLFYCETALPAPVEYRVLPVLADAGGRPAVHKRHNLLPPPGIHRLRRPGSGSELLDLRDYLPGDPPKTIAWKVSARRDRLITKEFESEVPIRCTLFVDTSNSVRVGARGHNALSRLVEIAAAVSPANTGNRDLTGLCLFDEQHVNIMAPGRTPRHLIGVLHRLADAAGLVPSTGKVRVNELVPLAYAFAEEFYPHLLRPEVNRVPFFMRWFGTRPLWLMRRPSLRDRLHSALLGWAIGYGVSTLGVLLIAGILGVFWLLSSQPGGGGLAYWALLVAAGSGIFALASFLGFLSWQLFLQCRRRNEVRRKKLAALLSVRHGLAPGGLEGSFRTMSRWLCTCSASWPSIMCRIVCRFTIGTAAISLPLRKRWTFSPAPCCASVGKGHDNELFVLLADLIELSDRLEPLLRAVRWPWPGIIK